MKTRIRREQIIRDVAETLNPEHSNDLPMIRTALNDAADFLRKEGYTVPDFAQDAMVRDVRILLDRKR